MNKVSISTTLQPLTIVSPIDKAKKNKQKNKPADRERERGKNSASAAINRHNGKLGDEIETLFTFSLQPRK